MSEKRAQELKDEEVIDRMAGFLAFFAASKIYGPLDKLARPFDYTDIVSTINESLRYANVVKERPDKIIRKNDKEYPCIEVRRGGRVLYVRVPIIPSHAVVKRWLDMCKGEEGFNVARETVALAFAKMFSYLFEAEEKKGEGGE
ncbi:hypothetical protein DRO02_07480 [archaeon]|nr:MAG: hypothetical protein DRO02_07480 [archaeon]